MAQPPTVSVQPLTPKQLVVLTFIAQHIERQGVAPTLEEIGAGTGGTGKSTALECVRELERKGYLRREPREPRSLRLLHLPPISRNATPVASTVVGQTPLTRRQLQVLEFLLEFHQEHGYYPTREEISGHLGLKNRVTAQQHLKQLERKGCIRRTPNCARAFEVLYHPPPRPPATGGE